MPLQVTNVDVLQEYLIGVMDRADHHAGNEMCTRLILRSSAHAFTRECLALEADTSLGSGCVTRALDRLIEGRGIHGV